MKKLHVLAALVVVIAVAAASASVAAVDDNHGNHLAAANHLVVAKIILPASDYRLDDPIRYSELITMLERANGDDPVIKNWGDWSGDLYSRLGGRYALDIAYASASDPKVIEDLLVKYKQGEAEEAENSEPVKTEEEIRSSVRLAMQGTKSESIMSRGEFFEAFLDLM